MRHILRLAYILLVAEIILGLSLPFTYVSPKAVKLGFYVQGNNLILSVQNRLPYTLKNMTIRTLPNGTIHYIGDIPPYTAKNVTFRIGELNKSRIEVNFTLIIVPIRVTIEKAPVEATVNEPRTSRG